MLPNSGTPSFVAPLRLHRHLARRPLVRQDHGTCHLVGGQLLSKHLSKHLLHLSSVARPCVHCVLAQKPVCASAAEGNWSVYGMIKQVIKTSARGRISHGGTPLSTNYRQTCLLCHKALARSTCSPKLQTPSYTQAVEKWESDSDSDASDDDDLARCR